MTTLTGVPSPRPRGPLPDVLVLGGGIIGLAIARELAGHGMRVEVLERLERGGEASVAAAGMLAPLTDLPPEGPADPLFTACQAARERWRSYHAELEAESGLGVDYDTSGSILVALDEEEESKIVQFRDAARRLGELEEDLPSAEARHRVPDLPARLRRCLLLPGEHRVDNIKALAALGLAAEDRGATFSRGCAAESVEVLPGGVRVSGPGWSREAGVLVIASGAWSGRIRGVPRLPIRPVRGQMMLVGEVAWPWRGIVRGPELYAVRRGQTGLVVGSTVEETGFDKHTTVGGLNRLLSFLHRSLPGSISKRVDATWAGLRPGTPDGWPLLGSLGSPSLLIASGHYRNGILLAPWTARLVAEMILDGDSPAEAEPFRPDREAVRPAPSSTDPTAPATPASGSTPGPRPVLLRAVPQKDSEP